MITTDIMQISATSLLASRLLSVLDLKEDSLKLNKLIATNTYLKHHVANHYSYPITNFL